VLNPAKTQNDEEHKASPTSATLNEPTKGQQFPAHASSVVSQDSSYLSGGQWGFYTGQPLGFNYNYDYTVGQWAMPTYTCNYHVGPTTTPSAKPSSNVHGRKRHYPQTTAGISGADTGSASAYEHKKNNKVAMTGREAWRLSGDRIQVKAPGVPSSEVNPGEDPPEERGALAGTTVGITQS
jgi:hypothetical protein